jgi:type IV pilus assembly protein PilM
MGREIVGLKIGASRLSAACVASNGNARVRQIATAPLPPGVVVGGEVQDGERLAHELRQLFATHKLPRRAVRVGVSSNRVGVRTIELGGIHDPKQLGNAVRFRAQEALPIPLTEAVLDYQVLGEESGDEGKVYRVQFAVAYRDLVDGYVGACRQAGIRLLGIDLEAFALLRAVTPLRASTDAPGDASALVAVSLGAERSTLAVTHGTTCEFTRVIDTGGAAFTGAIARELEIEEDEAEQLKRRVSLDPNAAIAEHLDAAKAAKAREVISVALQGFARELVSSLQFYQNLPGSLGIREVVLAGGTSLLGGLSQALSRMVAVRVSVGDPMVNVDSSQRIKGGQPDASLAIPIGLGMGA